MEALTQWYKIASVGSIVLAWKPDIMVLVGDGSSVTFYIKDIALTNGYHTKTVSKNLKKLENAISPDFVRINQNHIVNLRHVAKMIGIHTVVMKGPLEWKLKITDAYRAGVNQVIGL